MLEVRSLRLQQAQQHGGASGSAAGGGVQVLLPGEILRPSIPWKTRLARLGHTSRGGEG